MFRKVREEVKSQVASNVATKIVDTGKEKLQEFTSNYQQPTPVTTQSITNSFQNVIPEKVEHVKSLVGSVKSGESSSIKEAIEHEVTVKVNTCVASMLVTFLIGFFTQLEYVKPVHPILSVPVFSILAFSACWYAMRYLTKDIKVRIGTTVFSGLFVGALARYLSIKLGQYQFITEDQPLMLFPLLGVCVISFIGLFRYIFEISKKYEERWQIFKTD